MGDHSVSDKNDAWSRFPLPSDSAPILLVWLWQKAKSLCGCAHVTVRIFLELLLAFVRAEIDGVVLIIIARRGIIKINKPFADWIERHRFISRTKSAET